MMQEPSTSKVVSLGHYSLDVIAGIAETYTAETDTSNCKMRIGKFDLFYLGFHPLHGHLFYGYGEVSGHEPDDSPLTMEVIDRRVTYIGATI